MRIEDIKEYVDARPALTKIEVTTELGADVLIRFANALADVAEREQKPVMDGRFMTMILMPTKEK